MLRKNLLLVTYFLFTFFMFGCSGKQSTFVELADKDKKYQEQIESNSIFTMNLEKLFPDSDVRELARAAAQGEVSKITFLINSKGLDVNSLGVKGVTPLFYAMRNKIGFEALLKSGANPNIILGNENSVLHMSAKMQDCGLLKLALQYGGDPNLKAGYFDESPIFDTFTVDSYDGASDCMKILLDYGADINLVNNVGHTPIISAALLSRLDIVLFLLERGARTDIQDINGKSLKKYIILLDGAFRENTPQHKDLAAIMKILK